uniref:Uncharacterized protein n=1 Tax=Anguilla anguilla TaxID=7936 RepID=A0A0E9XC51_ANGAN
MNKFRGVSRAKYSTIAYFAPAASSFSPTLCFVMGADDITELRN